MTDDKKEQLKQYILAHKEKAQEIIEATKLLSENQKTQEILLKVIEILKQRGNTGDLLGVKLIEGFIEAANQLKADEQANAKEKKEVQKAKSVHAENHSSPIATLAKVIFGDDDKYSLEYLIKTANSDSESWDSDSELKRIDTGKKIYVLANLRFEDLPEKLQKRLADPFVRAVHDSMTSLIDAGNKWITLQHIAFAMNGYNSQRKATPAFLKQIEEAVEILRHTWVKIDATNEAKEYCKGKGYDFEDVHFDGALIASDGMEAVSMNGQRVRAYKILRESILYSYASKKKQIISVPMHLLALPERLNLTRDNIILQRYLLERIELMKTESLGCVIKYETIYELLGVEAVAVDEKKQSMAIRNKKRDIRDKVRAFLDNWKDLAYIKGYQEESKGRVVYSVRIDLFKTKYSLRT